MMRIALQELQEQISAGRHEQWNKAVSIFDLERTPQIGLEVRGAFLVVAFRYGLNNWGLISRPYVTKENALSMIAESYQGTSWLPLNAFGIDQSGKVTYPNSDETGEIWLATLPVGLVFVGPCSNGIWADEVGFVGVEVLAKIVERSEEEELRLLEEFVFETAEWQIRKLQSN